MADFKERWPTGMSGEVEDLRDGTSIRGLSPYRGSLGMGPTSPDNSVRSAVERLFSRLRHAASGVELQQIAVSLVGPQCFAVGVIAGIGADIVTSVVDLLKLLGKFVLADLHEVSTGKVHWLRFADPTVAPRMLIGKLAGTFFGDALKQAADERNAMVQELSKAFDDPKAFFDGMADQIIAGYQKEWQEFQAHMRSNSLEGRFKAGMIFGKLLMVVLGVATGVYGAAKLGAKGLTQLPKLAALAKKVKLKAGDIKVPHAAATNTSSGGASGVAQPPSQAFGNVQHRSVTNTNSQTPHPIHVTKGTNAPTSGPVNFMEGGDRFFVNASKRTDVDPNGFFDVVAHGSTSKMQVQTANGPVLVDHRVAAKLIEQSPSYNGQNIRLLSCSTGGGDMCFAQNLANKMGVKVEAPTDLLWAYPDGRMVVAPQGINGPNLGSQGTFKLFTPEKPN